MTHGQHSKLRQVEDYRLEYEASPMDGIRGKKPTEMGRFNGI